LRFYFNADASGAMFRRCDHAAQAQALRHEPGRRLELSPAREAASARHLCETFKAQIEAGRAGYPPRRGDISM
jgi:hypothetical protein